MADSPFIGPTYPVGSKPTSVARTVNMMPVAVETGNERQSWVFKDVAGLVNINPTVAPSQFVNCDLLLHYNETLPSGWLDYSTNRRVMSRVLNSTSTMATSATAKIGGGAARFTQAHPAGGASFPNDSAWLTAAGDINFGASDFFMCAWVYLDGLLPDNTAPTPRPSMSIFSALNPFDNIHNSPWYFALTASPGLATVFPQGTLYWGGGASNGTVNGGTTPIAPNTWTHVAFSRVGGPTNDALYTYINGVQASSGAVPKGVVVDSGTLGYTRVGAHDSSTTVGAPAVINGFNGLMDEAYINHGPGTGISVNFTPPTVPFDSTHTLRQTLGIDP